MCFYTLGPNIAAGKVACGSFWRGNEREGEGGYQTVHAAGRPRGHWVEKGDLFLREGREVIDCFHLRQETLAYFTLIKYFMRRESQDVVRREGAMVSW